MQMREHYQAEIPIGTSCPIEPIVETVLSNSYMVEDPFGDEMIGGRRFAVKVREW